MKTELNPTGCPHTMYHYNRGSARSRINGNVGGIKGIPSAKCSCGADLIGEDEILKHYKEMNAWLTSNGFPERSVR